MQCICPCHSGARSSASSSSSQQVLLSFTGVGADSLPQQMGFQQHCTDKVYPLRESKSPPLSPRGKRSSLINHNKQQSPHDGFEATGLENIRMDLAFHGIGSINWGNLVAMGERLHKTHLQQVQQEMDQDTDWVGEPAWDDEFKGVAGKHAKKLHYKMEWAYFGGQTVAHIPDGLWWAGRCQQQCC